MKNKKEESYDRLRKESKVRDKKEEKREGGKE